MGRLDEREVISKIRSLRKSRGVTLEDLAKMTGVTKGYLSQIENSTKAPPFSTLDKIGTSLGVDITYFFANNEDEKREARITLVRPNERKKVAPGGHRRGYGYESLAYKKAGKNMEPYLITVGQHSSGTFRHDGEEFLYILEGSLELNYGGEKYLFKKGDSIYLDSGVEHSAQAGGERNAKLLCIIYNYRRP